MTKRCHEQGSNDSVMIIQGGSRALESVIHHTYCEHVVRLRMHAIDDIRRILVRFFFAVKYSLHVTPTSKIRKCCVQLFIGDLVC